MIKHRLNIDYELGCGWLTKWVEALREGCALARRCATCAKVSFAPERVCTCGSSVGKWQKLAGTATIEYRTSGQDGEFALANFDGAQTFTVVALNDVAADQNRGRLVRPDCNLPRIMLGPLETAR